MKYQIYVGDYGNGEYSISVALAAAGINIDDVVYVGRIRSENETECDYIKLIVRYSFKAKIYGSRPQVVRSLGGYLMGDFSKCKDKGDINNRFYNENGEILGREIFDIDETVTDQIIRDVIVARSQLEDYNCPSEYKYYCRIDDLPEYIEVIEV